MKRPTSATARGAKGRSPPKSNLTLRLDADLLAWIDGVVAKRHAASPAKEWSRSDIVREALHEYRARAPK